MIKWQVTVRFLGGQDRSSQSSRMIGLESSVRYVVKFFQVPGVLHATPLSKQRVIAPVVPFTSCVEIGVKKDRFNFLAAIDCLLQCNI